LRNDKAGTDRIDGAGANRQTLRQRAYAFIREISSASVTVTGKAKTRKIT
jgi:hypothetical protein